MQTPVQRSVNAYVFELDQIKTGDLELFGRRLLRGRAACR
jgi:hypothetical protein